ncbi:hypothetical protein BC834DRAFT_271678 [Gloeopeniophorella convolvens]|nr:hypothetical protein BC834DRAFT_271678 [Gloeopeniophorella convolvens]
MARRHSADDLSSVERRYSSKMSVSRIPSYAPPPYAGLHPDDDASFEPIDQDQEQAQLQTLSSATGRLRPYNLSPLRVANPSDPVQLVSPLSPELDMHSEDHSPTQQFTPNRPHPPISPSIPGPSTHSSPPSPVPSPLMSTAGTHLSLAHQTSRTRPKFRPLAMLKLSKTARQASAQIAEQAAWRAAEQARQEAEIAKIRAAELEAARRTAEDLSRREAEEAAQRAAAQAEAKANAQSIIRSLLLRKLPTDEEHSASLSTCAQACNDAGLDFPAVLQEPFIEGHPPVYWAILTRVPASEDDEAISDALTMDLLDACQPLAPLTLTAVRLACMTASDNTLLQRFFCRFPALSPLSASDTMLLGPAGGKDEVDVDEMRDGTGTFIAHIKILRFRLRMRVSNSITIEFVASERIWTLRFSTSDATHADGRSESKWLLSLELGEGSPSTWIDADLFITGRSYPAGVHGPTDPILAAPLPCIASELCAGSEHAISVRLDDGPMGPHLLNESSMLVDDYGTLHAQFNARLARAPLSPPSLVVDTGSTQSPLEPTTPISALENTPPPSLKTKKKKAPREQKEKPVYTSLRRGGR